MLTTGSASPEGFRHLIQVCLSMHGNKLPGRTNAEFKLSSSIIQFKMDNFNYWIEAIVLPQVPLSSCDQKGNYRSRFNSHTGQKTTITVREYLRAMGSGFAWGFAMLLASVVDRICSLKSKGITLQLYVCCKEHSLKVYEQIDFLSNNVVFMRYFTSDLIIHCAVWLVRFLTAFQFRCKLST